MKLIGDEYDNNGNAVREYIYLENMPIALISNERNGEILQIHTDHLQTPKVITDKNGTVLWQWETEAFGSSKPKIETIKMPLRMAGQYADDEVGLFYNYYRFYDPNMGRYVENDPIGLEGGLNVYGYVGGSPLHKIDPRGLVEWTGTYKEVGNDIAFIGGKSIYFNLKSKCVNGKQGTVKVITGGIGASGGLTVMKTWASFGGGKVTLNDNLTEVNPDVFNGVFYFGGVGWLFHGSRATVVVGGAKGSMSTPFSSKWKNGWHNDIITAESVTGGAIAFGKVKDCGCEP